MLKRFIDWFESQLSEPESGVSHTKELATAVLLCEVMRADNYLSDEETEQYSALLNQHFSLTAEELAQLMALGKDTAKDASDLVQFTRTINQHCDGTEKREILSSLWQLAYADGRLDPHEEHIIRRIADLMYIPHSQFIQSKLTAQPENPQ